KLQENRSESAGPSCISMTSDHSMDYPLWFNDGDSSHSVLQNAEEKKEKINLIDTGKLLVNRSASTEPSCISMRSDYSMDYPLCFNDGDSSHSITCNFHEVKSWSALVSALSSDTSNLKELHLTVQRLELDENKIGDLEVKNLFAGLKNPHCKVKTLRLRECGVSDEGCAALTSALGSNPSHLRELNLSFNNVGDSGVKCLSAVLENPHCKLETL
ncbi:NACHT, LRR and PYD domains-containing protein 12-like, partial [Clarias magur]